MSRVNQTSPDARHGSWLGKFLSQALEDLVDLSQDERLVALNDATEERRALRWYACATRDLPAPDFDS
jgi:hypothetical protein